MVLLKGDRLAAIVKRDTCRRHSPRRPRERRSLARARRRSHRAKFLPITIRQIDHDSAIRQREKRLVAGCIWFAADGLPHEHSCDIFPDVGDRVHSRRKSTSADNHIEVPFSIHLPGARATMRTAIFIQGLLCTQSGLGRETADAGTKILRPCFTRIEIELRFSRFAAGSRSSTRKFAS
jgi:hypothetical protein